MPALLAVRPHAEHLDRDRWRAKLGAMSDKHALAAHIAEQICTDPDLAARCASAQDDFRANWRASQAAVLANDHNALAEILAAGSGDTASIMYAGMHVELCDACDRHEQILDAAAGGLLRIALGFYGFYASLRPDQIGVAGHMARVLVPYPGWLLERLGARLAAA